MPVPHFNIKITQRSKGNSAVAGAAYQAGEKLFSEYDQKTKNYTCKKEVVYTEIMLPPNAPPEYADRARVYAQIELSEQGKVSGFTIVVKQADEENKLPNRC